MIGGAEVQQYLIANEFKKYFDVSYITYSHGSDRKDEEIDEIRVIKSFDYL